MNLTHSKGLEPHDFTGVQNADVTLPITSPGLELYKFTGIQNTAVIATPFATGMEPYDFTGVQNFNSERSAFALVWNPTDLQVHKTLALLIHPYIMYHYARHKWRAFF